jgi:hypothetical protein
MNAVNWLKRRVSLASSSSSAHAQASQPQHTLNNHNNNHDTVAAPLPDQPHHNSSPTVHELSVTPNNHVALSPAMNVGTRSLNSAPNSAPMLMKHDIIDPSSPLSILAATSNLTTFPYGELQALNARMNTETANLNPLAVTDLNGVLSTENGALALVSQPLQRQKTRAKERNNLTQTESVVKTLLPSAMPPPPSSFSTISYQTTFIPTSPLRPSPTAQSYSMRQTTKQRSVTGPVLRTRSVGTSHVKTVSLSSTQNTRSSKRVKSFSMSASSQVTPSPKPIRKAQPSSKVETIPIPAPTGKKRTLPVRQGHIDIIDGEISLLSTPQRLDSIALNYDISH